MNWRKAKRRELITIVYYDDMASQTDRLAAAEELHRRRRPEHGRVNFKEKAVYPR